VARIILDTGVLIDAVRGQVRLGAMLNHDDVALSVIVLTEFLEGAELDPDEARQAAQRAFLDDLRGVVSVEDYTGKVVPDHVQLLVHTRRTGRPRGAHDLIVAATARATGRTLLTTDSNAAFHELPGLDTRVVH
jgi:tRNA(fMet)-specific endonuclease VapC